jgi:hypothetical protein
MCDYSLYTIQNRLAEEGEELVLHKFETGTLGFASVSDLLNLETTKKCDRDSFWTTITAWLLRGRAAPVTAVCIPPGTRLFLTDVPRNVQRSLCIAASEVVVFTELSSRSYSYRDALLLPNNTRVLLQDLPEGIRAIVLPMSPEPAAIPVRTETYAA